MGLWLHFGLNCLLWIVVVCGLHCSLSLIVIPILCYDYCFVLLLARLCVCNESVAGWVL